jgi:hypothetical protein
MKVATKRAGDAHDVGVAAYTYLYSLVTMEITRLQTTNIEAGREPGKGPMNTFSHFRAFPDADFKVVVRPNFDTLYSTAFLDLSAGPIIVSAGADADGRYYELPMYDMWTDAFAVPGQRTSGTETGHWAVVPPGWSGTLPDGVDRINAPTPTIWIIGRTQTNGPADYPTVHKIQDAFALTPLANWNGRAGDGASSAAAIDPSVDMTTPPLELVNDMSAANYFDLALRLLTVHPPHATDWSLIAQMKRIGLSAGARFADLDPDVQSALSDVPSAALAEMQRAFPLIARVVNGWQMNIDTMGVYGNFYIKRAIVAMIGLGANSAEDAVYPVLMVDADGNPLDGSNDYLLHFEKSELPPVHAFWSVTMYDDSDFFLVANPIDRYSIGDRTPGLERDADGGRSIVMQHDEPAEPHRRANWLPTPAGGFRPILRCMHQTSMCSTATTNSRRSAESADPFNVLR